MHQAPIDAAPPAPDRGAGGAGASAPGGYPDGEETLAAARAVIRRGLASAFIIGLFVNLLILASPIYMLQVYDRVLMSGHLETLLYLTLIVLVAVAFYGLLEGMRTRILSRASVALEAVVRGGALASWLGTAPSQGTARDNPANDLQTVCRFMQGPGPAAFCDVPWAPLFLGLMFLLHPWLGVLGVAATASLALVALTSELAARRVGLAARRHRGLASDVAQSAAQNADSVAAMGMMGAVARRHGQATDLGARVELRGMDRSGAAVATSKALRIGVQILVLGLGAFLVLRGELTAGGMIAASIILGRALAPAEQAIGSWRQFVPAREAWARLSARLAALQGTAGHVPLPRPEGSVAVEGVCYAPDPEAPPILRDVRFEIMPGEVLAVVGPSGAGKSTLLRVMAGALPPDAGHVRLGGADIYRWAADERGRHVGYLAQETDVFFGTVAENISRLQEPEPEAVLMAARLAGVHDMALRLPHNYATPLGAGGVRLSGGQRQRLGLARALYGGPALLILDEPNANLDREGEVALAAAIEHCKRAGVTVVMAVHRMPLLTLADKVLVMRDGAQEAFGPAAEVLRAGGMAAAPAPAPARAAGGAARIMPVPEAARRPAAGNVATKGSAQ